MTQQTNKRGKFCNKCKRLFPEGSKCPKCGGVLISPPTNTQAIIFGVFLMIIVVGIGYFVYSAITNDSSKNTSYTSSQPEKNKPDGEYTAEAYVCAEMRIENLLKNPSSAKFEYGGARNSTKYLGDNRYEINSYVDAENGFGGTIRSNFVCNVKYENSTDRCETSCEFIDK